MSASEGEQGGQRMRKYRYVNLVVVGAVFAMVAAACGGSKSPSNTSSASSNTGAASTIKVALALDVGGLGDKSFNDSANRGLQKAITDGLVTKDNTKLLETNQTGSNRDENVTNLADGGYDYIFGIGFSFSPGVDKIAAQYPNQKFAIIDGYSADAPNVVNLTFKANEGSFLVGAAAAMKSQTGTIGFLGGQQGTGLIENFQAGYEAGAKAVNPNIKILVEYCGDSVQAFVDPTKGEALSSKMYDEGADVIYHAAGQSGLGLFKAAAEANQTNPSPAKYAIGVDSDQYLTASPDEQKWILTSMVKHVDNAVYAVIKEATEGKWTHGTRVFGLAENGVDYATSSPLLTSDIKTKLEDFRQKIIAGTITVPTQPGG
jgi:basic membrane protein A